MCVCGNDVLKCEGALTDSVRAANNMCGLAEIRQSVAYIMLDGVNTKWNEMNLMF